MEETIASVTRWLLYDKALAPAVEIIVMRTRNDAWFPYRPYRPSLL
jgi:hypothetical protein